MLLLENALKYAEDVIAGKEITTWEVKYQCTVFINDYYGRQHQQDFKYYFDESKLDVIEGILSLLNYATGFVAGMPVLDNLAPFHCFTIANIFGWRFKDNEYKFRYNDITLFVARKNAKTALVAIIFILLMLTEQDYSEFYSICLTRELASEIRKAMTQILEKSPHIAKYFKISKTFTGKIECKITNSFFQPRVAEAGKNNSIRPSAFVSDEHANFQSPENFNAMRSGQKNVINPLSFRTTTAYEINNSIMEQDLEYIRKVLKGDVVNERVFALLYYAEKGHEWDDIGMLQANPLRVEENYETIREDREKAKVQKNLQGEYLTKSVNVFKQESGESPYIDIEAWRKQRLDKIDLEGKEVIVSVDASITTDLTAINIEYEEDGNYYLKAHAILPRGSLIKRREKIDYEAMERLGYCTICEGEIVSYRMIEDYIRNIEGLYGCKIKCIVSDPFNIVQTMENLAEDYEVILLKQNYTNLSAPTKDLRQQVYDRRFFYEKNDILDFCVECATTYRAKVTDDILLVKENKHKQRIDLIVAGVFAHSQLYLNSYKAPAITEDYLNNFYNSSNNKA